MPDGSEQHGRLVDDTLFVQGSEGSEGSEGSVPLRGAVCGACGTTTFPAQGSCPRCGRADMSEAALPTDGTLWSFTVQYFEPKPPFRGRGEFVPYGVGYVDLGPVIVESLLTVNDPAALRIGDPMCLTTVHAFDDENGTPVRTFAFAPRGATA